MKILSIFIGLLSLFPFSLAFLLTQHAYRHPNLPNYMNVVPEIGFGAIILTIAIVIWE